MTSLEICEVTGKHHHHTTRLIKKLIGKGIIGTNQFGSSSYMNKQNKKQPMYELDKTSSILVVAQQSVLIKY